MSEGEQRKGKLEEIDFKNVRRANLGRLAFESLNRVPGPSRSTHEMTLESLVPRGRLGDSKDKKA